MSKLQQLIKDFHQALHIKLVKGEFDIYEKKEISKNYIKYDIEIEGISFSLKETIFKKRKSGEIKIDDYNTKILRLSLLPEKEKFSSSLIRKAIENKKKEIKKEEIKSKINELEEELKNL